MANRSRQNYKRVSGYACIRAHEVNLCVVAKRLGEAPLSTVDNGHGAWLRNMTRGPICSSPQRQVSAGIGRTFGDIWRRSVNFGTSPTYPLLTVVQAETFSAPNAGQQAKGANSIASYHGTSGPVQVTYPDLMYGGPQQGSFVNSTVNLMGIKHYKDLNGGTPNCVSITPLVLPSFDITRRLPYFDVICRSWTGTTQIIGPLLPQPTWLL